MHADRPSPASPSAHEVRAQLDRIVASDEFAASERARRFLRHVVEEALAGRGDRIKAYAIAIEVLGRDKGFDANADPIVRIEAARLRRALERYYLTAGRADPVLIEIPKGAYVPVFTAPAAPSAVAAPEPGRPGLPLAPPPARPYVVVAAAVLLAAVAYLLGTAGLVLFWPRARTDALSVASGAAPGRLPAGPVLAVVPFADLGGGPESALYADGLGEELLTQLAPFKELAVLGRETSRSLRPGDGTARVRELGAGYALEGGVRVAAGRVRVTARLIEVVTGSVLWSEAYDADAGLRNLLTIEEGIARQVVTEVAQPYGAISRAEAGGSGRGPPDDPAAYACTLRFYDYEAAFGAGLHAEVRDCLERAVERHPRYATAWAMLSILYLDEERYRFNPRPGAAAPVGRASDAAERAMTLDPDNARARQALMLALVFRQQVAEALRVGERGVELNPNDTALLGEYGLRLALSGEWERGGALLEQALARNPALGGYYHTVLALDAYMRRDGGRALVEIRQANLEKYPFFYGIAAAVYAEAGMGTEAGEAVARFASSNPRFVADPAAELARRLARPEGCARLLESLRKAGLPVRGDAPTVAR